MFDHLVDLTEPVCQKLDPSLASMTIFDTSGIELLDTRIQIRPDFRDKLIEQLKGAFGKYYDYHCRDIAADKVDYLNVEDPDVFSHRAWELEYQSKQEIRRNQPAKVKKKSHDMEL